MLYGPDGKPISSTDAPKPAALVKPNGEPVKRKIREEDIEGLDPSKEQFIYAKTADGKPATHGNDYKFFAHELDPAKMKEVDPKIVYVGKTDPKALAARNAAQPRKSMPLVRRPPPPPRNRKERRISEARKKRGTY